MKILKKSIAVVATTLTAAIVFSAVPATASPADSQSKDSKSLAPGSMIELSPLMGGFTASDWQEIARAAEKAGDLRGAQAARQAATMQVSDPRSGGGVVEPANIFTTAAKKALITALRFGGEKLPQNTRPYAHKIANVIEETTNLQEGALISALQFAGIPYDVAAPVARWCVLFIGL